MIDIHCHILHGLDDGARTFEVSLNMARQAASAGVHTLVCTPHSPDSDASRRYSPTLIAERVAELQEAVDAADFDLKLLPGTEIRFVTDVAHKLRAGTILSLAGSRTVLIEMPVFAVDHGFLPIAKHLISDGYTVVLAHPERYIYNKHDFQALRQIHDAGVLFQVTAIAVDDANSTTLFAHDLVDLVASDAHSDGYRPTAMGFALEYVTKTYGTDTAQRLFVDVPQHILARA